jgi:hypothetical protein
VSLAVFEQWLASESWNMFSESAAEAVELVAAINLLISEHHDKVIDDNAFRSELLELLNNVSKSVQFVADDTLPEPAPIGQIGCF